MTTDFAISALQIVYHTLVRNTTPPEGDCSSGGVIVLLLCVLCDYCLGNALFQTSMTLNLDIQPSGLKVSVLLASMMPCSTHHCASSLSLSVSYHACPSPGRSPARIDCKMHRIDPCTILGNSAPSFVKLFHFENEPDCLTLPANHAKLSPL